MIVFPLIEMSNEFYLVNLPFEHVRSADHCKNRNLIV